jgi:hypothetical protein
MSVTYTLVRTEVYTVEMEDVSQASEARAIDLVFSRSIDPDATELDIIAAPKYPHEVSEYRPLDAKAEAFRS